MKESYLTGKPSEVILTALSITMNNFQLIKKSVAHNSQQFIFIHYDYQENQSLLVRMLNYTSMKLDSNISLIQ